MRDQPFGIEVRNVRCLKCRKWGHINTDKVCPLFGKSITAEPPQSRGNHPGELMEQMKEDGLEFTKKVLSRQNDPTADNQQMIDSEAEDDEEVTCLINLFYKSIRNHNFPLCRLLLAFRYYCEIGYFYIKLYYIYAHI